MKSKTLSAVLAASLSLPALSSMAAVNRDLLGETAPALASGRTIEITPDTRYVNVQGGQTVTFDVGGQSFTWVFDGPYATGFDLNRVMPPGLLDHPVTAFVSPNPLYEN